MKVDYDRLEKKSIAIANLFNKSNDPRLKNGKKAIVTVVKKEYIVVLATVH